LHDQAYITAFKVHYQVLLSLLVSWPRSYAWPSRSRKYDFFTLSHFSANWFAKTRYLNFSPRRWVRPPSMLVWPRWGNYGITRPRYLLGSSSLALELFKKVSPPQGKPPFVQGSKNQVFSIYLPERVRPGHKNFIATTHILILYLPSFQPQDCSSLWVCKAGCLAGPIFG